MIKVIVELHPYGDEPKKSQIKTLYIVNEGGRRARDGLTDCTYAYWVGKDPQKEVHPPDGEIKTIREEGVFSLIQKCLEDYTKVRILSEKEASKNP